VKDASINRRKGLRQAKGNRHPEGSGGNWQMTPKGSNLGKQQITNNKYVSQLFENSLEESDEI
jgi:hypothetical protein